MEDFVEYQIYNAELLHVSQNCQQDKTKFIKFGQSLIHSINKLSTNYLWRKHCFYIEPKFINDTNGARINNKETSNISYFEGKVYYAGDINDEWFIVYLLYQISSIHKNTFIEMSDNDGQFLLIHSAYNLPKWIEPQTVKNRVYIYQNNLHLIPLKYKITNNKKKSIELLLNNKIDTLANDNIQNSIHCKLKAFSESIYKNPGINYHFSVVVLPKKCAHILNKYPFIISNVIECFVNGNENKKSINVKKERKFKLDANEYVFTTVRFTQFLYGMLSFKSLKSAPIYFRKNKFDFNQYKKNKLSLNKTIIKNAFLNGIKLMIGFEIFYEKCIHDIKESKIDQEWVKFKKSLIKKGYFNECFFGSDTYIKKEESAKKYYNENIKQENECNDEKNNMLFCVENGMINNNNSTLFCLNVMNNNGKYKSNSKWIKVYNKDNKTQNIENVIDTLRNDSEDWMQISDKELNRLLNEYTCNNDEQKQMLFEEMLCDEPQVNENENDQQTKDDILSLKESLNSFMDKKSYFDGVEMENENNNNEIQFNAETVLNILDEQKENKNDRKQDEMKHIMNEMDEELFIKQKKESQNNQNEIKNELHDGNKGSDIENEELDIDLNIVNNILKSHVTSQMNGNGLGPATTLLSQMGFQLK